MRTNEPGNGRRIKVVMVLLLILCIDGILLLYPSIYEHRSKNRVEKVNVEEHQKNLLNATIRVIRVEKKEGAIGYSQGASGVVFAKEGRTTYYALTAHHVVSGDENDSWLVQTAYSPSREQYYEEVEFAGNDKYYSLFPNATVEAIKEESDLAIIRFESEEELYVLEIDDTDLEKGEDIVLLGAPYEREVNQYYGKIKSEKYYKFSTDDGRLSNMVLKHSAFSEPGSSGAAIVNKENQIVGINIGGGTDFLGRYQYGAMIPAVQIKQLIEEWGTKR